MPFGAIRALSDTGHAFPNKAQADKWLNDEWLTRHSLNWFDRHDNLILREFVNEA